MSFNFGNTSTGLGNTSTPAKPTGFGNFTFGGTPTTSAPPAFGTIQSATAAPSFGNASSTFGGIAGNTGGGFGSSTVGQQSSGAFGFGTSTSTATTLPIFGTTGFGTTQPTPAINPLSSTLGGFGGFGQQQPAASTAFGGLGAATTNIGFGSFGGFGNFNTTAPTSVTNPLFNGFGTTATSTTTGLTGFGNTGAFGGFGTTGFGQQLQQQQQQHQQQQQQQRVQLNPDEAFAQSIFNVSIFGDERDTTIAKLNYLQAMWGVGKAFYSQSSAPVEITPQNYLCRFKTMGYTKLPGKDNKMGLVMLIFNKGSSQIKEQQQQLINQLNAIFGNKPNLLTNIDNIKSISDTKSQVIIFIEEKSQLTNETKRILATELCNFLNQPMLKSQLTQIGVEQIISMITPDEDQLKEYLENPPKGIDPRMWKQAKEDNPDPTKFIPVPIIGFNELKWRIKCQENETETHIQYIGKMQEEINELKQRHINTTAKIIEYRRKLSELSHRILKIVVKQECTRKLGVAISPEEEVLRTKLENMQAIVSAPTQFKGRLNELLSQMRMHRNQWNFSNVNEYSLDEDSTDEMKTFLTMQQKAMAFLIDTVKKDMKALNIITDGIKQFIFEE